MVSSRASGETRNCVSYGILDERCDAQNIFKILCDTFGERASATQLMRSYYERKQRDGESIIYTHMNWHHVLIGWTVSLHSGTYVCLKNLTFNVFFSPIFNLLSVYLLPVGVSGQNEIGCLTCSAVHYWKLLIFAYLYSDFDLEPELLYIHAPPWCLYVCILVLCCK